MIPTYNQARFIRKAIESALEQSYGSIEVVVGDDSSTDDTPLIVSSIKDDRLRYVRHQTNLGRVGNYRRLLYEYASGDFVVNLDGDDYFTDPQFLAEAAKLLATEPSAVMVVARAVTANASGHQVSRIPRVMQLSGLEILRKMPNPAYCIMHLAVVYSRKQALALDFYRSQAISSDWESLYRLALRGTVKYLDRQVGVWRIHETNETATGDEAKLLENLAIWHSVYEDAKLFGMNPLTANVIKARCIAQFIQSSCIRVSMSGNARLYSFLSAVLTRYRLAFSLVLLNPAYMARILLCALGYYRKQGGR